jgi:hypothetical protein
MLKSRKIYTEDGKGFYRVFFDDDVEKVDPFIYFPDFEIRRRAIQYRDMATIEMPKIVEEHDKIDNLFFVKRAAREYRIEFDKALVRELPIAFCKLLDSKSKKEQVKLLKNQVLSPDLLFTLILKANRDFNYTFSRYKSEKHPKDVKSSELPTLIEIESDNSINIVGNTNLSEGKLKQVIEQRKVIVANFFDKGDNWHCFFLTFRSLVGKETWNDGQPHYHYISDKWNHPRADVISAIKSGQYPTTSVHIGIDNYELK